MIDQPYESNREEDKAGAQNGRYNDYVFDHGEVYEWETGRDNVMRTGRIFMSCFCVYVR